MVHGIHTLTQGELVAFIKHCTKAKKTKVLCDGGGLYLRSTKTGTASWIFRYESDGDRHEKGLGSFHTFTLKEVRERARLCRQLLADNRDPIAEGQAARIARLKVSTTITSKSFKYCALRYIAFKEKSWNSDKHRRDWEGSLAKYVYPIFGAKPVSVITQEDVLKAIAPHWEAHTESLKRVRGRIEAVIDWATGQKLRAAELPNPARWKGGIEAHLNADVRKPTQHFRALHYLKIPELTVELMRTPDGAVQPDQASDALLFCLLTACRSRELRFATWQEIDMATGVWTIPAARMKAGHEHRVPLSERLLALLRRQLTFPQPGMARDGFIFCDSRCSQRAMPEGVMRDRLQQLYPGASVHGTARSGFADWSVDVAQADADLRERCLAHAKDAVVGAYQRSDRLVQRRDLLLQWEDFCTNPIADNVTPLHAVVA